jgi:hypothetical protein
MATGRVLVRRSPSTAMRDAWVGPLPPIGTPGGTLYDAYDSRQLARSTSYAASWPLDSQDLVSSYYYDLGLTLYHTGLRSGDAGRLAAARAVCAEWKDLANNQQLHTCMTQPGNPWDYNLCDLIMSARNIALGGVALLGLDTGNADARTLLDEYAGWVAVKTDEDFWDDPRENGYRLLYLCAAVAMGYDRAGLALTLLNTSLAHQEADGHWSGSWVNEGCTYEAPENFMLGLWMEALACYDRVIGDARILPAIQDTADWLWDTQWQSGLTCFRYSPEESVLCIPGDANTHLLSGMFLPGWGYLYYHTGLSAYKTQGDLILQGMMDSGDPGTDNAKFFGQTFRSSSQYLGYVALAEA